MRVVEYVGIAILAALAILALVYVRRSVIVRRGGVVAMSVRLTTLIPGRGWAMGLARFVGDELHWYRIFSLWPGSRRLVRRTEQSVEQRRAPDGAETLVLPDGWVVVRCVGAKQPVEIAMAEPAVTGFLSWMESAPPGSARPDTPRRKAA